MATIHSVTAQVYQGVTQDDIVYVVASFTDEKLAESFASDLDEYVSREDFSGIRVNDPRLEEEVMNLEDAVVTYAVTKNQLRET